MDRRPDEGAWPPEDDDRPATPGRSDQPGRHDDRPPAAPTYPGYGGYEQAPPGGGYAPGSAGAYPPRPEDRRQRPPDAFGAPPGGGQPPPGGYAPPPGGYPPPPAGYPPPPGGYPGQGGYGPPPGQGYGGSGPGWREGLKAGNERTGPLPLHPMNIGDILDGAFKLLKANFLTLILVTAAFVVPLNLLTAWSQRRVRSPGILDLVNDPLAAQAVDPNPLAGYDWVPLILGTALGLLVTPLVAGVVSRVVASSYLGTQLTAGQALAGTVRYFPALLVSFIIVHAAESVALIACVIPVLFVMPLFMVTSPAIVIEDMPPLRGMVRGVSRSVELTASRYWPVVGIALLSGLIAIAVNLIVTFPLSSLIALFGTVPWPLTAVASLIPALVTTPLITIVAVLVYFDLRIRREGFDLQMIATGLGEGPSRGAVYGG